MTTPPNARILPERVSVARHDLRNALGEIMGFAELIAEEATDLGESQLVAELPALQHATEEILKRLGQILTVEHLTAHPDASDELGRTLQRFSQATDDTVTALHARCAQLPTRPFLDDLLRICASARRLGVRAPELLAEMFAPDVPTLADLEAVPVHPGGSGETTFFRKPTGPATEGENTALLTRAAVRPPATGTILVVDDTESNRALLTRRLSREGFTVAIAEHGRRALDLLGRHAFDLVLLDIMMPEMDGHQVLTAMKTDPALRHIPVIMISGLDDLDTLVRCIEGGAEDYLTKPFDPVLLRARIGACLDKNHLRDRELEHLATIEEQRRRADELLHVILPHSIAVELKETNGVQPRHHPHVAGLFSDVVGFTAYCDQHPATEVIVHLQALVRAFEEIAARHGLEKIKTIGDAFMATAGLIEPVAKPALNAVRAGLEMVQAARSLGSGWEVHIGVHSGPVISGVVGQRKYLFDVWGDTVNTASRMCGLAGSGELCVSEHTWRELAGDCTGVSAGTFPVKGKGELQVFRVTAAR